MARTINDDFVDGSRRDFRDCPHVEASCAQHADDTEVAALVGMEAHAARASGSRARGVRMTVSSWTRPCIH